MTTIVRATLASDGELILEIDHGKNPDGSPAIARRAIRADQIAAHRRDPDFEASLPAELRALLDAPIVGGGTPAADGAVSSPPPASVTVSRRR